MSSPKAAPSPAWARASVASVMTGPVLSHGHLDNASDECNTGGGANSSANCLRWPVPQAGSTCTLKNGGTRDLSRPKERHRRQGGRGTRRSAPVAGLFAACRGLLHDGG